MIENLRPHRPAGCSEREIKALSKIAKDLFHVLKTTQASLAYDSLVLAKPELESLSIVLVEFAEDLLNGLGIWESMEGYNRRFFGTALPFSLSPDCGMTKGVITRKRLHYLLWNKYSELCEGLLLSPGHRDLGLMVEGVFHFFNNGHIKEDFPRESSVRAFLGRPNDYGWDIKKKLLWLGRQSYLFRYSFAAYMEEYGGEQDIQVMDDFVCQHTTRWSGLGVPGILSGLTKKGVGMTEDEVESIRGLITSPSISPRFVEKLTRKHGAESIAEAFVFKDCQDMDYLQYILRQYKGQHYRTRYPNLSLN